MNSESNPEATRLEIHTFSFLNAQFHPFCFGQVFLKGRLKWQSVVVG